MGLTVFRRYAYDDVSLLASTDPAANAWRLEVEGSQAPEWLPVDAIIMDSHMNWSTPDLTLWNVLRRGEPSAIQKTFSNSSHVVPAGVPFAVTWNLSTWYEWKNTRTGGEFWFRFTDPVGTVFDFQYQSLLGEREHVFG